MSKTEILTSEKLSKPRGEEELKENELPTTDKTPDRLLSSGQSKQEETSQATKSEEGKNGTPPLAGQDVSSKSKEDQRITKALPEVNKKPSVPLKSGAEKGAVPKLTQEFPYTFKSNHLPAPADSSPYLSLKPDQPTSQKSSHVFLQGSSSYSTISRRDSNASGSVSCSVSSILPTIPQPFQLPSEDPSEDSLVRLNKFLSLLRGTRNFYSVPDMNSCREIARIDKNVRLNERLALDHGSTESLIAVYDLQMSDDGEQPVQDGDPCSNTSVE